MAELLEQIASELSVFRSEGLSAPWTNAQHFCLTGFDEQQNDYSPTADDAFLYEVLLKGIHRGSRPFVSHFAEQWITALYGKPFEVAEKPEAESRGSIKFSFNKSLASAYDLFTDVVAPWEGAPDNIAFDPEHPENERELFCRMLNKFGPSIAHCLAPQVKLSTVLAHNAGDHFMAQRADMLLYFPSGKCLLLEPGDHNDDRQIRLDRQRDAAFRNIGIETLRPDNDAIYGDLVYRQIGDKLDQLGAQAYLKNHENRDEADLSQNYLFLLPALLARVERLLLHFLFRRGMIHKRELCIGLIERDLECAELAIASTIDKITRLAALYGIELAVPKIQLFVKRNSVYRYGDIHKLGINVTQCNDMHNAACAFILDVGVKCNNLTMPVTSADTSIGWTRRAYPHNRRHRFGYTSRVKSIQINEDTESLLEVFVKDFFRKQRFRPGQVPVLLNILSQKATIGLLPTSAGKSLCYQLAALLTPGTTLVVDPLVALMKDQVQSLTEQFGIDRVLAWHASAGLHEQNLASLLSEHAVLFISPERLQRPRFRMAMQALNAADIYINYAVVDEAHCVSMWGHDFRPAYLTLEKNFRQFCTFQGRTPVLVALTGTASQLVLIDLKRELDIQEMDAIVRPATFDRKELNFNLVRCPNDHKNQCLNTIKENIARRLNVSDLPSEAHGIVFTYTPKEAWELFGEYVGQAQQTAVQTILAGTSDSVIYGMYTGSPPRENGQPLFSKDEWENYKEKTLSAFKRGGVRMLFGNTAVSVGIDNEYLNYVINYRMPQSMEAYYQQCGRAGRSEQRSECYLIFSDDLPQITRQWLDRETPVMPRRRDDLGTVAYFHQLNFPEREIDVHGAIQVCRLIFGNVHDDGTLAIPAWHEPNMTHAEAERTERYISYWLILGVIDDYEVEGMGGNTVYRVRRSAAVETFLRDGDMGKLESSITTSLHQYFSRYRPMPLSAIVDLLKAAEGNLSRRSVACLVNFIYENIEYQRRASIRTMVAFCNEEDTNPEVLRRRIKAYFDSSEKFSKALMSMAESETNTPLMSELIDKIEGFDDIETLFWETRRLLDERYRTDWAALNLFAILYREHGRFTEAHSRMLVEMVESFQADGPQQNEQPYLFLSVFLKHIVQLGKVFPEEAIAEMTDKIFEDLYTRFRLEYMPLLDELPLPDNVRDSISAKIVAKQMKEINDDGYSRCIG
jgi:superfamily II DNA helicase RecQ